MNNRARFLTSTYWLNGWIHLCFVVLLAGCARSPEDYPVISAPNLKSLRQIQTYSGDSPATSLAFHPSEPVLAIGWQDGRVSLTDLRTEEESWLGMPSKSAWTHVAFSPDGEWLAVGNGQGVALWDLATLEIGNILNSGGNVSSLSFDPTGQWLAAVAGGRRRQIWNLESGQRIQNCECNDYIFRFSPDELWAVSTSIYSLDLYNVKSANMKWISSLWRAEQVGDALEYLIESIAFSSRGDILAVSLVNDNLQLWDLAAQTVILKIETPPRYSLTGLAFSLDGTLLAGSAGDNQVYIWDTNTGGLLHMLPVPTPYSLTFSSDSRFLAVGSWENSVTLWAIP